MRSRSFFLAAGACALGLLWGRGAHAETAEQRWRRLLMGGVVREPQTLNYGSRRFVGGVSYALTDGGTSDVGNFVDDVKSYTRFLPLTRKARVVGENGPDRFIEFVSGNAELSVRYTMRFRRESERVVRFWIDPSKPHDVSDAWGYLRWQPVATPSGPQILLTYGVLAELPDDFTRDLIEHKVQRALLSVLPRMVGAMHESRLARGTRTH